MSSGAGERYYLEFLYQDARNGDPEAQYTLAHLYLLGKGGVKRDINAGMEWLGKAAELGHPDAPFDLGILYLDEQGGTFDSHKAYLWLKKAANEDHVEALYILGQAYKSTNPAEGLSMLRKARELGHEDAAAIIIQWCSEKVAACD